ncbi:hypothetical protein SKAU_G00422070 [Synaphobranchus kaupii]|uniref:Adhesion G protein-coupled receptor B N-terminal domain-containing protein n=1 Tax=Synaphobranchus kaupii TaxID=118154 RepID=A0A9Q1E6W8_SYNKA|nr:hypothetical protein SKAU_G00422070 [Synaphobranchus kaupii]
MAPSPCGTSSPPTPPPAAPGPWRTPTPPNTRCTCASSTTPPTCHAFAPMLLPLDHYLANQSCAVPVPPDPEVVELCRPPGTHAFMQFDKNFVQLCLTATPSATPAPTPAHDPISVEMLAFHLVEVLLINNENSSQFTCGVLCRWFEECLRSGGESEGCGITQTGCICPDAEMFPPFLLTPATPSNDSAHRHAPDVLPGSARQLLCDADTLTARHRSGAPGRPAR